MAKKKHKDRKNAGFMFKDFLWSLFCLIGAAICVYLFINDLNQTGNFRNEESAGTITIKHNTVQRQPRDRKLWDRLRNGSPVYSGDLIRIEGHSDATLQIAGNYLYLNENTSIRIRRAPDGTDFFHVDLAMGSLSLNTGTEGGKIRLNIMGSQVDAGPGTTLSASAGADGITVQISEGDALFTNKGQKQALVATAMVALDSGGKERVEPAAVVKSPPPDAHYLKSGPEPLNIGFAWDRHHLLPGETLRMEIAEDRNFSRNVRTIENLDSTAETALGAGQWYWRLTYKDAVLGTGKLTVADAVGPELLNPITDQQFRFPVIPQPLRFQWSKVAEASAYIFEVSPTDDFTYPRIRKQVGGEYVIESSLEEGTWRWRVKPIFPDIYKKDIAAFSSVSSFRIERGEPVEEPLWPEPVIVNAPAESPAKTVAQADTEPPLVDTPPAVPVKIRLITPAHRASLPGLTALRQQTEFRWDSDGKVEKTRFVLSRNSNPLRGKPAVEIANPGRTIYLDRLEEGMWYWTVEAQSAGGPVRAEPRRLVVQPIPLLNAPGNRQPADGYRINIEERKKTNVIKFGWSPVQGANAYIFTLYQQTANGRRRKIEERTLTNTGWTLDDVRSLDEQGKYIWQVEAVNRNQTGKIDQHGSPGENTFIMDIPWPDPVQLKEPEAFYE
jgi:hypothetical protein